MKWTKEQRQVYMKEYQKEYREKNQEKLKKYQKDHRKEISKWHKEYNQRPENKKKHNKRMKEAYYRNKIKWRERKFVSKHRKEILKLLPSICAKCGKEGIKEIHHITYNLPKRKHCPSEQQLNNYLKEYCKYLLPFCSRRCHRDYEKSA